MQTASSGTQQGRPLLQSSRALAVPLFHLPAAAPRPGRRYGTSTHRTYTIQTRATWFAHSAEAIAPPLWFLPQCRDAAHAMVDSMCQGQAAAARLAQGLLQALQQLFQATCAALGLLAALLQQWAADIATAVTGSSSSSSQAPSTTPTTQTAATTAASESHSALKDVVPRRVDMRPNPPALSASSSSSHLSSFWSGNWAAASANPGSSSSSSSGGGLHLVHGPQGVAPAPRHHASRGRTWFNGASEDRATDELGFAAGASSEDVTTFLDADSSAQQQAAAATRRKQQKQRELASYWAQLEQQQQPQQVYQMEVGQVLPAAAHWRLPQVGWGHVAALGLVGWVGWRLAQRLAARAQERAQQSIVEEQLQQQALAEALAGQRARMRRALAPKDASSSSSARAASLEENMEADLPPVAGVLPRPASPGVLVVPGMDKEAVAAFQKFLQSSGMAGVAREAIWVKEKAEEHPKGSAEELQRLTDKLRQAVDASDLEAQQAGDKAALAELLGQNSALEEEQAAGGGGWEGAGGGSGAARRRRARSPSLELQGQGGEERGGYGDWDGMVGGAGGRGEEGMRRRSVSPTEELRSGSKALAAEDEEEEGDFNPFALTAEAREKWEADDHLYTSTPKTKGFGWGNKKKAVPKRRSPSPQQVRRRRPLSEADYEFALPKKPVAGDNSSSSSSSSGNGAASGTAGGTGEVPADPWSSSSSSSSSRRSLQGADGAAGQPERAQMPAVAAAAAEEDLQQVTPALGTPAGKQLRSKQQAAAGAGDGLAAGVVDAESAGGQRAGADGGTQQQQPPKPRPMRIRK